MKLFFSNKGNLGQSIKLVEENELPQNDKEVADEVNSFFKSTIPNFEKKIIICFITSQTSLTSNRGLLKLLGYHVAGKVL